MANRFWVGSSGSWSDSAHWSTTSGGAGGASVPTSSDAAIFDGSSFSGASTVQLSSSASVASLNMSGVGFYPFAKVTLTGSALTVYGDVTLSPYLTIQTSIHIGDYAVSHFRQNAAGLDWVTLRYNAQVFLEGPFSAKRLNLGIVSAITGAQFYSEGYSVRLDELFIFKPTILDLGTSAVRFTGAGVVYLNKGFGVLLAHNATISYDSSSSSAFDLGGTDVGALKVINTGTVTVKGNNTIDTLELSAGSKLTVDAATTQTVSSFIANGTSSKQIVLRSGIAGTRFKLSKPSGTVDAYYLDLKDSEAIGGATWNAHNSVDSGNNTGWNFIGPVAPTANFTADITSGRAPLTVQFSDTSTGSPTSWAWNFGDGTTSTAQNPTKTYSIPGTYTIQLYVANNLGGSTKTVSSYITATVTVVSPTSIAASDGLGEPSVVRHGVAVNLDSIDSSAAFGEPSIGRQLLALGDIPTAEAFGELSTVVGNKTVFPEAIAPTDAFGTPDVIRLGRPVDLPSIQDGETFDEPTILRGPVGITEAGDIESAAALDEPTLTQSAPPPPPPTDWSALGKEDEKHYIYKVYRPDGAFLGTWIDVKDDPQFTQRLNTPGTTMTVQLTRSPSTTKEMRDVMTTEDGTPITTEAGDEIMVSYETNNSVGEGTDVDINYYVDVYVVYGGYDVLTTEDGEPITTEDGEELLVTYGAPNGIRIFSGFILDYESLYGERTGVTVTLASHGYKLSHEVVRSGEVIRVSYSSQPVHTILKSVLDTNPQVMTYSAASINTSNPESITAKFVLNTKLEAIESLFSQTLDGWYWYGNVADNYLYLQPTATTPHHTFIKGFHIKELALRRSFESLRNKVYFVGAEASGVNILKKYEDSASQLDWGVGLHRITDRRFSVDASMQRRANKEMSGYKKPIWTTTVKISSAKYNLESVKLGQVVTFRNFGNFVDGLLLQIVGFTYKATELTLELGELLEVSTKIVADIEEGLQNEQYEKIPDTPS